MHKAAEEGRSACELWLFHGDGRGGGDVGGWWLGVRRKNSGEGYRKVVVGIESCLVSSCLDGWGERGL